MTLERLGPDAWVVLPGGLASVVAIAIFRDGRFKYLSVHRIPDNEFNLIFEETIHAATFKTAVGEFYRTYLSMHQLTNELTNELS